MMFGPYGIILILVVAMVLFIWGKWRYDVVAVLALFAGVVTGAVPYTQFYMGFSNAAVVTVACVMIISTAINRSGVIQLLVDRLSAVTSNTTLHLASISVITAALSAFMNNVGALAFMMPVAIKSAVQHDRSPSLVLMPIAFASALGGLLTMIGTPPNLLVAAYRHKQTGEAFSIFSFTPVGLAVACAGVAFIVLIGWRLLPRNRKPQKRPEDIFQIEDYITEVKIPETSKLIDMSLQDLYDETESKLDVVACVRKKKRQLFLSPRLVLKSGDVLLIEGAPDVLQAIMQKYGLEIVGTETTPADTLLAGDMALVEAVIPPGSRLDTRTASQMRFRSRHRINLLAISRQGRPIKKSLQQVKLRVGDVILLQGDAAALDDKISGLGLLPLVERGIDVGQQKRSFVPIVVFALAILSAVLQLLPVPVAFAACVLALVLLGRVPARTVYDSIEWPVIVLLAAMIPLGQAFESTGASTMVTKGLLSLSGYLSPTLLLALLLLITMTLSDVMNNAATTVVMLPIAESLAQGLHVSVDPFFMAVAVGASCSFLTPIGHQNNTLVMGPGGYQFADFVRLGLPLELIVLVVSVPMILWVWPL